MPDNRFYNFVYVRVVGVGFAEFVVYITSKLVFTIMFYNDGCDVINGRWSITRITNCSLYFSIELTFI